MGRLRQGFPREVPSQDEAAKERSMQIGDDLPEIEIRTADGEAVPLARYVKRVTVIQLLRYYG